MIGPNQARAVKFKARSIFKNTCPQDDALSINTDKAKGDELKVIKRFNAVYSASNMSNVILPSYTELCELAQNTNTPLRAVWVDYTPPLGEPDLTWYLNAMVNLAEMGTLETLFQKRVENATPGSSIFNSDVNEVATRLREQITNALDEVCPLRVRNKRVMNPWFGTSCKRCIVDSLHSKRETDFDGSLRERPIGRKSEKLRNCTGQLHMRIWKARLQSQTF